MATQVTLNSGSVDSAGSLLLKTNGTTTAVTLDTAQNMGLGVTPSAWAANFGGIELGKASVNYITSASTAPLSFLANAYYNGSNYIYKATGYATNFFTQNGAYNWQIAPSGTVGNAITFTQAMTLDASGNLGVGTTSPACRADVNGTIRAQGATISASGEGLEVIYTTTTPYFGAVNTGVLQTYNRGGSAYTSMVLSASQMAFATAGSERARIDTSGNLLVGTTGTTSSTKAGATIAAAGYASFSRNTTSSATVVEFINPNGQVGTITMSGTSTAYNTSSDYRLKNTVAPMTGALTKVALLKPCTYKWNADGSDGEGFIAHELAEVVPQCVTGEKDAVETYVDEEGNEHVRPKYQGIDTSFLVATLTAAIQELKAEVDSLKAQIAGA